MSGEDIINLILTFGLVILWLAQRLFRAFKKNDDNKPAVPGETKPSTVTAHKPVFSFEEKPTAATEAVGGGAVSDGWNPLMDRIVEVTDRARHFRSRVKSLRYPSDLPDYLDRLVLDRLADLEGEFSASGAMGPDRVEQGFYRLAALQGFLDGLEVVVSQRTDRGTELALGERFAQGLMAGITPFAREGKARPAGPKIVAISSPTDSDTIRSLSEMGLVPVEFVSGWSTKVDSWPELVHGLAQLRMAGIPGLRAEIFQRFGLSPQWPVPYTEPVYVTSADVLGPFGAWLDTLVADLVCCLSVGPSWVKARVRKLALRSSKESVLTAPVSRSGFYLAPEPPDALRVMLLAHLLDITGSGEAGGQMVSSWEEEFGSCEGLWMPTRRSSFYGVPVQPYLEAGQSLLSVLHEESFAQLGSERFSELPGLDQTEVDGHAVGAWAKSLSAGHPMSGPVRLRVASALHAWPSDPAQSERIAHGALYGLLPERVRPAAALNVSTGGGLLELSPKAIYEAVIVRAAFGRTGFPWRPSYGLRSRGPGSRGPAVRE